MLNFGIDVSRDKLDCAVLDEQGQRVKRPRRFVMEATAAYHKLTATRLHGAGRLVSVVNPAQVRSLARGLGMRSKTDSIDAVLLAHYGRLAGPRPWRPVQQDLAQFNAMLMRLDCIETDLRREQNRREQASVRCSADCVLLSIDHSIECLRGQRKSLRKLIDSLIESSPALSENVARLRSIRAAGEKTANRMAAVLGTNSFVSAKEAAAFLGLVPVKVETGVSVKGRSHLSKAGNPRVRASPYMAAVVAKKVNPEIKALYERLCAQGKSRMPALGACMRKLVHLCFGVLKSGKDYVPPEERNTAST